MKKITAITISLLFIFSMGLTAQPAAPEGPDSDKKEKKADKKVEPNYMLLGLHVPFLYFIKAKDSSINYGVLIKAPVKKDFGIEVGANNLTFPTTEYKIDNGSTTTTYTGWGEEYYTNFRLDFLYFFEFYRFFQVKAGVDYYKFNSGYIAAAGDAGDPVADLTPGQCGQLYSECRNCQEDQFGVNVGVNLDVNLYKDFYILTSLGYRYLFSDHQSAKLGIIDFTLGLGYRL